MKKFLLLLSLLGGVSISLSAQNIYIRGQIQVIDIGPGGIDVICHPPYTKDCLTIISEPPPRSMVSTTINKDSNTKIQPKVQIIGEAKNNEGNPTNVYRIRRDAIKEVIKK